MMKLIIKKKTHIHTFRMRNKFDFMLVILPLAFVQNGMNIREKIKCREKRKRKVVWHDVSHTICKICINVWKKKHLFFLHILKYPCACKNECAQCSHLFIPIHRISSEWMKNYEQYRDQQSRSEKQRLSKWNVIFHLIRKYPSIKSSWKRGGFWETNRSLLACVLHVFDIHFHLIRQCIN